VGCLFYHSFAKGLVAMINYRLSRIYRLFYLSISELHWSVLFFIALMHGTCTYFLLLLANEQDLAAVPSFIYWYATTAFTVGYGDISPKTEIGRLIVAFFVMPGAIAIFTTVLTKIFADLSAAWRKRRDGMGSYHKMKKPIVLIGYDPKRTEQMVDEIHADTKGLHDIILVTTEKLTVEDPRYRFVLAQSLTSPLDLKRAGVENAGYIVIFATSSAETLSAALAVTTLNKTAHIVCFFQDSDTAQLLKAHCPHIEVVVAPTVELVVKALRDPGSSKFIAQLASHTDNGATLYSHAAQQAGSFSEIAKSFIEKKAVLVAVCHKDESEPRLNVDATVEVGDRLFYIAQERIA
jgi:voltage-gated potassium channel